MRVKKIYMTVMSEKKCKKGENHFEITKYSRFFVPLLMHKSRLNEKTLLVLCLGETKTLFIKRGPGIN